MATEEEDPRDRVWRLLMEKERYTDCPREVMGALDALGVTNDVEVAHAELTYDDTSGATDWTITAATRSTLIRIRASATRADRQVWSVGRHRDSIEYTVAPTVDVDVRPLTDIERVELNNVGATDAWQPGAQVVQTWTFHLRGADTVELRVDTGDRFRSEAVGQICSLFARQVTSRSS
ncbi:MULTISPECIES: hypothetical protein [unclassified Nocardioides]|uniref:hypothetical protein n=1 Tax=unclassified Nocardioides TaxID=2615069 RepID=UPI0000570DAA|nr:MULTISPECIES: hypothetical protein [unclassified Nocardioides]ABL79601.1 hypothetical protein Noca_0052 [Nocardioides sp. JS614]